MRTERAVGATAIALVVSVVIQNVVLASGAPTYSDPMTQVLTFHSEHRGLVTLAVGLEALNVPCSPGVRDRLARAGHAPRAVGLGWVAAGRGCGRDGVFGFRPLRRPVDGSRALRARSHRADGHSRVIWRMHAAAFGFALAALGSHLRWGRVGGECEAG